MVPVSFVGYPFRVPRRVPEMLTLAYFFVHSLFALYALKSLVFRRFRMKKGFPDFSENPDRGASRVRTGDPLLAKQMRYQLRYSPVRKKERLAAASFFLWAREDLNLRPHPYQGCALTS